MSDGRTVLGVIELRQYTLHPGQREALIGLFDEAFIEPQEAAGISVLGQFRDLDEPDRFVWLRGFPDMLARPAALGAFYGGPVWAQHREAANATMVDSDDVLLLRPLPRAPAFPHDGGTRRPLGQRPSPLVVTVYQLDEPPSAECVALLTDEVEPLLASSGAGAIALLQTEPAPNNFPGLPVRDGEHVLVRVARFPGLAAHAAAAGRLAASPAWRHFRSFLTGPPHVLHLEPTDRSLLR